MKTSERGVALLKKHEGLRLTAYPDPGSGGEPWTIGYGSTKGVKKGMVISAAKAEEMMRSDLANFESEVARLVKVPVTQNQFDALVSFTYNLGAANLASSTLLKLLNQGKYTEASGQFGRWVNASGKVLPGLVKRREEERQLFLS